jgi:hypothetical protein
MSSRRSTSLPPPLFVLLFLVVFAWPWILVRLITALSGANQNSPGWVTARWIAEVAWVVLILAFGVAVWIRGRRSRSARAMGATRGHADAFAG